MTARSSALLFSLSLPLLAGEVTLESQPFRIEHRFDATVLPVEPPALELAPESWTSFVIDKLADHGTPVKKGDVIVAFDREAYDRRIEDLTRTVKTTELAVARQKLDVEKLAAEHALALSAARRTKEIALEDLEYFKTTGRPAAEEGVEKSLVGARFGLESAREELKQLKQMYEADDLTEDTEEIILKRQQISVEMETFQLAQAERAAKIKLEYDLPRQLEGLERAAEQATLAFEKTEKNLPRALEEARLALQGAEAGLAREKLELERLGRDGALFEWKATADGIVFHGGLGGDAWDYGDLAKVLKIDGTVPLRKELLTLVPADPAIRLRAKVEPKVADTLKKGGTVTLRVPGGAGGDPVATVAAVETVPGPDGTCGTTLTAEWPEGAKPEVGTKAQCLRVAYTQPEALVVPEKALVATAEGGWAVELKLADGKTDQRPVKLGRTDGKQVQILEGLEAGQVIVVPE
jgi:hypothetical protein